MPPLPNFSSVAGAATPPPGTFPQGPAPSGTDSLAPLFQALAQAMAQQARTGQGRLSLQGAQTFGRHLGTGGAEVTPQNPTGNPSNPWDAEGLFHGGMSAQLSPEARAATQGRSAMTQWAGLGQQPGVDPNKLSQLQSQMTPQPKNYGIESVDQFSDPFFKRRMQNGWLGSAAPLSVQSGGNPNNGFNITPPANLYNATQKTNLPKGAVMGDGTTNYFPAGQAPKRKGSSFNFMGGGSPRPGFGF